MRAALLLGLLVLSVTPRADACSCGSMSPQRALRQADVVFAGRVEDVTVIDKESQPEPRIIVKFRVGRVWKGDVGAEFIMHTHFEAASCRGFFRELARVGEELLVFSKAGNAARWKQGDPGDFRGGPREVLRQDLVDQVAGGATIYTTSICSGTVRWEDAGFAVHWLGEFQAPRGAYSMTDAPPFDESKLPPQLEGLPMVCWNMRMQQNWEVLEGPPKDADVLYALLRRRTSDAATAYAEHWFKEPNGKLGLCRVPDKGPESCGGVAAVFEQSPKEGQGKWMLYAGDDDPCVSK